MHNSFSFCDFILNLRRKPVLQEKKKRSRRHSYCCFWSRTFLLFLLCVCKGAPQTCFQVLELNGHMSGSKSKLAQKKTPKNPCSLLGYHQDVLTGEQHRRSPHGSITHRERGGRGGTWGQWKGQSTAALQPHGHRERGERGKGQQERKETRAAKQELENSRHCEEPSGKAPGAVAPFLQPSLTQQRRQPPSGADSPCTEGQRAATPHKPVVSSCHKTELTRKVPAKSQRHTFPDPS